MAVMSLAYITLNPFSDWRHIGIEPWAFVGESWPKYWTWFDLLSNAAAYAPLGLLGALAVYPRVRALPAFLAVTLLASVLSFTLEALQTYLPARIPSWVDWLANTVGAALGAALGATVAPALIDRGPLRTLRDRWFTPRASVGLALLALWLLAQVYPQPMLMATGRVIDALGALSSGGAPATPFTLAPRYFVLVEALGVVAASTVAAILLLDVARPDAPRATLIALILAAALAVKSLATGQLLGEAESLHWLSAGAQGGLVVAALTIAVISTVAPRRRLSVAVVAVTLVVALANFAPENAYYHAMLGRWDQGAWVNVNGLLYAVSVAWPFATLVYLLVRRASSRA